jgi:hypothetical protein
MKKFVIKALFFAALVVGVIGGLCAWEILAEVRAYRAEVVAPQGASILLCGDSQFGNSVDPQVCPEFFNFSAHGRALDQSYMIALDALRANKGRIRSIVVDVSPAAATWPLDSPLEDMSFSGNYWLVHYLHPRENTRDLSGGFRVVRDCLVGRRLRHAWRAIRGKVEFHSSIEGKYTPSLEVNKRDNPRLFDGLMRQKARLTKGAADIGPDSLMFATLDKMVRLASEEGVGIVVVTTPWHPDLIELCGEAELDRFVAKLSAWAAGKGVKYVSFLKQRFPEECWLDSNHLNARGAKTFTPMLLEAVR